MDFDFNRYRPQQDRLSEIDLIHSILDYVITELPSNNRLMGFDPSWVCSRTNLDDFVNLTMHRMVSENLIRIERSPHSSVGYVLHALPYGVRVAQSTGGYRGHMNAQRQEVTRNDLKAFEAESLNREVARATIGAATSAEVSATASVRAIRVSIIGTAIASIIALSSVVVQIVSADSAAVELAIAKEEIKLLQQQVDNLNKRVSSTAPTAHIGQVTEAKKEVK